MKLLIKFVKYLYGTVIFFTMATKIRLNGKLFSPFNSIPLDPDSVLVIFDIGANVGTTSFYARKNYKNAVIYCFEPVLDTFALLQKRLSKLPGKFVLFDFALGNKTESLNINITNAHGANSILPQSSEHKLVNRDIAEQGTQTICVKRLDEIASSLPKSIDIMKIDVEGFEHNVLSGGYEYIKNAVKYIIIEVSFVRSVDVQDRFEYLRLLNILGEMGFWMYDVIDIHKAEKSNRDSLIQFDAVLKNVNL